MVEAVATAATASTCAKRSIIAPVSVSQSQLSAFVKIKAWTIEFNKTINVFLKSFKELLKNQNQLITLVKISQVIKFDSRHQNWLFILSIENKNDWIRQNVKQWMIRKQITTREILITATSMLFQNLKNNGF